MEGCGSETSFIWDGTVEDNIYAKEGAYTCGTRGAVNCGSCRRGPGAGAAEEASSACQSNGMAVPRLKRRRTGICGENIACEEEEREIAEKAHETLAEQKNASMTDLFFMSQ